MRGDFVCCRQQSTPLTFFSLQILFRDSNRFPSHHCDGMHIRFLIDLLG